MIYASKAERFHTRKNLRRIGRRGGGRSEEKGEEERVRLEEWFSRKKIVSEEENKYRGGT